MKGDMEEGVMEEFLLMDGEIEGDMEGDMEVVH